MPQMKIPLLVLQVTKAGQRPGNEATLQIQTVKYNIAETVSSLKNTNF